MSCLMLPPFITDGFIWATESLPALFVLPDFNLIPPGRHRWISLDCYGHFVVFLQGNQLKPPRIKEYVGTRDRHPADNLRYLAASCQGMHFPDRTQCHEIIRIHRPSTVAKRALVCYGLRICRPDALASHFEQAEFRHTGNLSISLVGAQPICHARFKKPAVLARFHVDKVDDSQR